MTEGPPLTTLWISGRSSAKLLSSIPRNLLSPEWSVFKYNILFPIRVADCELTNCSWSASEMDEQRNVDEPVRSKARNQPLYSRRSTQYHNRYNSPRSLLTERADLDYLSPRSLIKYTLALRAGQAVRAELAISHMSLHRFPGMAHQGI